MALWAFAVIDLPYGDATISQPTSADYVLIVVTESDACTQLYELAACRPVQQFYSMGNATFVHAYPVQMSNAFCTLCSRCPTVDMDN